jgi:hypothetical protein
MMELVALHGSSIVRIELGFELQIFLSDASYLAIENDFSLLIAGAAAILRPSTGHWSDVDTKVVTALVGQKIMGAQVDAGTLTVTFESCDVLQVEPNVQYEAWNIAASGGARWVAYPGGEVGVWPNLEG